MTEHSVSDNIGERLPNWDEQLEFAREVNECLQAGCTGYIYWYMRAHWAFVSTGESKYGSANARRNQLLPRAYVMSHFSKYVTGSTLLESTCSFDLVTNADIESSAFIKGDSLIIITINSLADERAFTIKMENTPFKVASGDMLISWGNEKSELCQKEAIEISEPTQKLVVELPGKSVVTYVFKLDQGSTAVQEVRLTDADGPTTYYDLQGRRLDVPRGLCIEKRSDGTSRKVFLP